MATGEQPPRRIFTGEAREVYSGDDLIVFIDLEIDNLWKRQRVRLYGVDTPNGIHEPAESEAGRLRDYVRGLVRTAKLHIQPVSARNGNMVAIVEVERRDGSRFNLNDDLIAKGYKFQKQGQTQ